MLDHFGMKMSHLSGWTLLKMIGNIFTAPPLPMMYCSVHKTWCFFKPCDLDTSGFPCVDFSPAGSQRGIYGGSFPVLLCLLAWHRCCRTRLVFLENVQQFPTQVLHCLMQDMYDIHEFKFGPESSGCEHLSRPRVFIMLLLRGQVKYINKLCCLKRLTDANKRY